MKAIFQNGFESHCRVSIFTPGCNSEPWKRITLEECNFVFLVLIQSCILSSILHRFGTCTHHLFVSWFSRKLGCSLRSLNWALLASWFCMSRCFIHHLQYAHYKLSGGIRKRLVLFLQKNTQHRGKKIGGFLNNFEDLTPSRSKRCQEAQFSI